MERKIIKIIGIIFIVFTIFNIYISYTNRSFALGDVTKNPDIWIAPEEDVGDDILNTKSRPITGIIRAFGVIASVITLAIIALRIIFGSTEEKANYKQTLLPWAVGAVMLFSMATIPSLVFDAIDGSVDVEELEIKPKSGIRQGDFCINNNLMHIVRGETGAEFKCYAEEDNESCGCKNSYNNKDRAYRGYYCKACYDRNDDGVPNTSIVKRLQIMTVEDVYYYYCAKCGSLYYK